MARIGVRIFRRWVLSTAAAVPHRLRIQICSLGSIDRRTIKNICAEKRNTFQMEIVTGLMPGCWTR